MTKFRKLKSRDKQEVENLLSQLKNTKKIKININNLIKDKGCNCLVVEENKQVIGFGSLIVYQVPCVGYVARIEDIIIDSNQRGRGYGKMLTEELIKIAKNKKLKRIDLTSNPKKATARKLYKNMGFFIYDTMVFRMDL